MRRFISFLVAALVISSAMLTPSGLVQAAGQANTREACPANPPPGYATCFSLVRTDVQGVAPGPNVSTNISGFGPTDLSSAYDFNPRDGWGQTVAIVDAFDDPEAETDLARYRGKFGIEPCTSVNR
ncbi:MAG TPA: peptidase S8, partial [Chloroflexota bacterium]|nr:peptidase S8 [Chloroflexota bacterium]